MRAETEMAGSIEHGNATAHHPNNHPRSSVSATWSENRGAEGLGREEEGDGEGVWRDASAGYGMLLLALHRLVDAVKGRAIEAGEWDR